MRGVDVGASAVRIDDLPNQIAGFFRQVETGASEIYNEFSLQHELGIHLRATLSEDLKLQFERCVDYFPISSKELVKKEIDIAIFGAERSPVVAIELKFPRNGQYPEQMFKACVDIMFLEQLVHAGFGRGLFVMAVDDPLFWQGPQGSGVYAFFRRDQPICGVIRKPTAKCDSVVSIKGSYLISWRSVGPNLRYCVIEVGCATGEQAALVGRA